MHLRALQALARALPAAAPGAWRYLGVRNPAVGGRRLRGVRQPAYISLSRSAGGSMAARLLSAAYAVTVQVPSGLYETLKAEKPAFASQTAAVRDESTKSMTVPAGCAPI